eukprot:GHVQ01008133.1.p1 GENE.GHVQ01008133.1~~GHVQ01008133.1.p1  ORF type:complete len:463 (+),score=71.23 GHVQ01008133.1:180-1568(+)
MSLIVQTERPHGRPCIVVLLYLSICLIGSLLLLRALSITPHVEAVVEQRADYDHQTTPTDDQVGVQQPLAAKLRPMNGTWSSARPPGSLYAKALDKWSRLSSVTKSTSQSATVVVMIVTIGRSVTGSEWFHRTIGAKFANGRWIVYLGVSALMAHRELTVFPLPKFLDVMSKQSFKLLAGTVVNFVVCFALDRGGRVLTNRRNEVPEQEENEREQEENEGYVLYDVNDQANEAASQDLGPQEASERDGETGSIDQGSTNNHVQSQDFEAPQDRMNPRDGLAKARLTMAKLTIETDSLVAETQKLKAAQEASERGLKIQQAKNDTLNAWNKRHREIADRRNNKRQETQEENEREQEEKERKERENKLEEMENILANFQLEIEGLKEQLEKQKKEIEARANDKPKGLKEQIEKQKKEIEARAQDNPKGLKEQIDGETGSIDQDEETGVGDTEINVVTSDPNQIP